MAASTGTSLFGGGTTTTTGSLFGATSTAQPSAFGGGATSMFGAKPAGTSLFGQPQAAAQPVAGVGFGMNTALQVQPAQSALQVAQQPVVITQDTEQALSQYIIQSQMEFYPYGTEHLLQTSSKYSSFTEEQQKKKPEE